MSSGKITGPASFDAEVTPGDGNCLYRCITLVLVLTQSFQNATMDPIIFLHVICEFCNLQGMNLYSTNGRGNKQKGVDSLSFKCPLYNSTSFDAI